MNIYKSCSDLKEEAKEVMSGKYGIYIMMFLIMYSASFSLQMILSLFAAAPMSAVASTDSMGMNYLIYESVVVLMLNAVITILLGTAKPGLAFFCLKASCGNMTYVSDIFYGLKGNFKKSLTLSAVILLPQIILLLPCNILQLMFQYKNDVNLIIYACLCFVAAELIYIPISLMFSMSYYLMLDFPQYSAMEILKKSIQITRGHRLRLFAVELSFIPVGILAILSFGAGFLWVLPYINMTFALFYLDLMNSKTN